MVYKKISDDEKTFKGKATSFVRSYVILDIMISFMNPAMQENIKENVPFIASSAWRSLIQLSSSA